MTSPVVQQTAKKAERITYVDSARGIAILMILWLHIGSASRLPDSFLAPTKELASFGVALFFMLAGYLFSLSLARQKKSPLKIILNKIKTILVPFYALSICFVPFVYINQYITPSSSKTWSNSLLALLSFDISDNLPSGVLWFLFVLFMFFMLTTLVLAIVKNKRISGWVLWSLSLVLLAAYPKLSDIAFMGLNRFSLTYFYFIFGFFAHGLFLQRSNTAFYAVVLLFLSGTVFIFYFYYLEETSILFFALNRLATLLLCLSIILICKKADELRVGKPGVFYFFGVHSMSIFVFHMPTSAVVLAIFKKTGLNVWPASDALWLALCLLVPLLIEFCLCFMPKLHQILLGRKPIFYIPRRHIIA